MNQNNQKELVEDIARKNNSIEVLKRKNIPYDENLKCYVSEKDCSLQSVENIVNRLTAVFATAVKGEYGTKYIQDNQDPFDECEDMISFFGISSNFEISLEDLLKNLEEKYNISKHFTEKEKEYMSIPLQNQEEKKHIKFSWKYECVSILLWSLSLYELKANELTDTSIIYELLSKNDTKSLLEKAKPKSKQEILDLQDLIFRYNWACFHSETENEILQQIGNDIIYEWLYTLNWLLKIFGIEDWEDVQVPKY